MEEQQPGRVISPGNPAPQPLANNQIVEQSAQPVSSLPPTPSPHAQGSLQATPLAAVSPLPALTYAEQTDKAAQEIPAQTWSESENLTQNQLQTADIAWSAAEYIDNEKNATWYGAVTLGSILLGALIYLFTKDVISTAVVVLAIGGLLFVSAHRPIEASYALRDGLIQIGQKTYHLDDFKAFSVDEAAPVLGISLMPLKRFMPPVALYVDEVHEQTVVDYISDFLPMEPHKVDAMDSLLRRLRF
ncbi:hypothetical protein IPL85_02060 [Candidatus Saccharibacteria bacterium]|nr:MAG: hypothetical protein IPL85_02060 [Candidatus Saccharibacteria bacterium]